MAESNFGERTEQATGKRRAEARRKGQVAKSREIPAATVMLAGLSVLFVLSSYIFRQLAGVMTDLLRKPPAVLSLTPAQIRDLSGEILWSVFLILGPVLLVIMAAAVLSNYVQVGPLFSLESIRPQFGRLNPVKGFSRLVSRHSAVELVKSIGKLFVIGYVAYSTIRGEVPQILALTDQSAGGIFSYIAWISFKIALKTFLVITVLAGLDYAFQRWDYEKSLRMTKREVQDEFKQTEGDPLIKSRIRSIQREMARRRMMAEVPKADVIITNPTHLAVALAYNSREMSAPTVIAKGAGVIAEKIKELGRQHRIPVVENKPLAQVLYKTVELGQVIPTTLYQMVADILAFVYRMKQKKV
jgi:flagellar biosynthesis protein FlhB